MLDVLALGGYATRFFSLGLGRENFRNSFGSFALVPQPFPCGTV